MKRPRTAYRCTLRFASPVSAYPVEKSLEYERMAVCPIFCGVKQGHNVVAPGFADKLRNVFRNRQFVPVFEAELAPSPGLRDWYHTDAKTGGASSLAYKS